jgi:acyl-CoA thioester hydrolase
VFETKVRVRFAETDAQGIVNNSVYLVWFELARVEYLERHAGGYPVLRAQGIEAFVTESRVRYLEPVRFDDRLTIRASCGDVRGARFRFAYEIDRNGDSGRRGRDVPRLRRRGHDASDPRAGLARRGDPAGRAPYGLGGGGAGGGGFGVVVVGVVVVVVGVFGSSFFFVPTRTTRFSPR